MSNGAQAARGNAALAMGASADQRALTLSTATPHDVPLHELLFDDPMDADGALEAAQISQAQIIERQAETIARLERHAARDKDYRTVTKVKLKEAAQRLKEYRLRVEELMGEVDTAKTQIAKLESEKKKALAQVQAAKKKAALAAPTVVQVEALKPMVNSIGVQTPWKTAHRTVSVQTEVERKVDTGTQMDTEQLECASEPVVNGNSETSATLVDAETSTASVRSGKDLEVDRPEKGIHVQSKATDSSVAVKSAFDAISAAIDEELDLSDDDGDDEAKEKANKTSDPQSRNESQKTPQLVEVATSVLDDAISREIDKELDFSSSSSDESSDDESDDEASDGETKVPAVVAQDEAGNCPANPEVGVLGGENTLANTKDSKKTDAISSMPKTTTSSIDVVSAAIDAELASDDDNGGGTEDHVKSIVQTNEIQATAHQDALDVTTSRLVAQGMVAVAMPLSLEDRVHSSSDRVGAAIDVELASTSEDDIDPGEHDSGAPSAQTLASDPVQPASRRKMMEHSLDLQTATAEQNDQSLKLKKPEATEQNVRGKSRTLSLSSDSSSSSSSSDDGGDEGISQQTKSNSNQGVSIGHEEALNPLVEEEHNENENAIVTSAPMGCQGGLRIEGSVSSSPKSQLQQNERKRRRASEEVIDDDATSNAETHATSVLKIQKLSTADNLTAGRSTPMDIEQDARKVGRKPVRDQTSRNIGALAPRDLVAFKGAISLQEGESPDAVFVSRTLGVLVKHVATLTRTKASIDEPAMRIVDNPDVMKLCRALINEHTLRQVSHEVLLEGMIRIFRTPRTRHTIERSTVVLTSIFQMLFFCRLGMDQVVERTEHRKLTTLMVPEVHQCLLTLRDLVVTPRLNQGLAIPQSDGLNAAVLSFASSTSGSSQNVSHDKAFLAHVCALYTTMCRSLERFDLPLILLLDIIASHPNIKGLYCAHAIVQVDPRVLRKRWDSHGNDQQSALRTVLVHLLQVITYRSRDKQEIVYRESALSLLLFIAERIEDPALGSINPGGNPHEVDDAVDSLSAIIWKAHILNASSKSRTEMFDILKALELLAAFHGDVVMQRCFPIAQFLTAKSSESVDTQLLITDEPWIAVLAKFIGAVAKGTLKSRLIHRFAQDISSSDDGYVAQTIGWMLKSCRKAGICGDELLNTLVSELTDLLIGVSSIESLASQRDKWLGELLQALPAHRLKRMSGQPLRQLRLLVMAARQLSNE